MESVVKWQFGKWLFRGLKDRPGYRQFIDAWLLLQIAASVGLAALVKESVNSAAQIVMLPMIAIFVGLSLAWVGNAQALLKESEIEKLANFHPDGLQTYVYTFQLAMLVVMATVVAWSLAALGVFCYPLLQHDLVQFLIEAGLYLLTCLTMRESWHVVKGSQLLILARAAIRGRNEPR